MEEEEEEEEKKKPTTTPSLEIPFIHLGNMKIYGTSRLCCIIYIGHTESRATIFL